jgi:hypothetical protein
MPLIFSYLLQLANAYSIGGLPSPYAKGCYNWNNKKYATPLPHKIEEAFSLTTVHYQLIFRCAFSGTIKPRTHFILDRLYR